MMIDKTYGTWNLISYLNKSRDIVLISEIDDLAYYYYLENFKITYIETAGRFDQKTFNGYYNPDYDDYYGTDRNRYYLRAKKQIENQQRKDKLKKISKK